MIEKTTEKLLLIKNSYAIYYYICFVNDTAEHNETSKTL